MIMARLLSLSFSAMESSSSEYQTVRFLSIYLFNELHTKNFTLPPQIGLSIVPPTSSNLVGKILYFLVLSSAPWLCPVFVGNFSAIAMA